MALFEQFRYCGSLVKDGITRLRPPELEISDPGSRLRGAGQGLVYVVGHGGGSPERRGPADRVRLPLLGVDEHPVGRFYVAQPVGVVSVAEAHLVVGGLDGGRRSGGFEAKHAIGVEVEGHGLQS